MLSLKTPDSWVGENQCGVKLLSKCSEQSDLRDALSPTFGCTIPLEKIATWANHVEEFNLVGS